MAQLLIEVFTTTCEKDNEGNYTESYDRVIEDYQLSDISAWLDIEFSDNAGNGEWEFFHVTKLEEE